MEIGHYEELKEVVKSGDHARALSRYADLINSTVEYIVGVKVLDEPGCMLESIKNQKSILEKAESAFEVLKKDGFDVEDSVSRLDDLCGALEKYEEFVKNMHEGNLYQNIEGDVL